MFKIHSSLGEFNTVQQIGQTPEENPQNTCQKKSANPPVKLALTQTDVRTLTCDSVSRSASNLPAFFREEILQHFVLSQKYHYTY